MQRLLIPMAALALVAGCSGSCPSDSAVCSSSAYTIGQGVFVDAPVEGLTYESSGITGTTDSSGKFSGGGGGSSAPKGTIAKGGNGVSGSVARSVAATGGNAAPVNVPSASRPSGVGYAAQAAALKPAAETARLERSQAATHQHSLTNHQQLPSI